MPDDFDRATGWDIFESDRPHHTGFKFIMPHTAILGRDLPVEFSRCDECKGPGTIITRLRFVEDVEGLCPKCRGSGQSVLVIQQERTGHQYRGVGNSTLEAIFAIIRQRMGIVNHECNAACTNGKS